MAAAHKLDNPLHLVVGDEAALHARRLARALRRIEHVALTQQFFRAAGIENRAAVDLAGNRERDSARNVCLNHARDDVDGRSLRRDDEVNARRARQLGQTADGFFHLARRNHHQVGQLVDDDDDLAHRLLVRADGVVVTADVAHAHRLKPLVAVLHFHHRPAERRARLLGISHDRDEQVRDAVVNGKLNHLRIDEDEPHLLRLRAEDDGIDDRVDADGFARTGRACNQHVRHFRHIRDDRRAGNTLAQRDRRRGFFAHHFRAFQHVAQGNRLDLLIRNFNADRRLAGNRRFDAHAVGSHVQRDVVHQADDARNLHARRGRKLITRDSRAVGHIQQLGLHAEALQRAEQLARARLVLGALVWVLRRVALIEQVDRREDVFLLRRLRRFMHVLGGHDDRRAVDAAAAQLHNGLLFVHPLGLQNVLPLRLNRRLLHRAAAAGIALRRIPLRRLIARIAFRARSGRVNGRRGIARRHASARLLGALPRPAAERTAHHGRRLVLRLVVGFVRRHLRVAVVVFDVRRLRLVRFFVLGCVREIAVVDGSVRTFRTRIRDGGRLVVFLLVLLCVCVGGHFRLDNRFVVHRRISSGRVLRGRLIVCVIRHIFRCRLAVCLALHIPRRRLICVIRRISRRRLAVCLVRRISRRRPTICVIRRIPHSRLTICVARRILRHRLAAVHAIEERVFRFLHGEAVSAARRRRRVLIHGRAGKLVVPLDIELRPVGNGAALARRGCLFRRPARNHGLVVRPLVLLRPHHGQRRLLLALWRLNRRFLRLVLRFKCFADFFIPLALFFPLLRFARGSLLFFLLLLHALLPALLAFDGKRVFAFQFFFLPRVAKGVLLLPAFLPLHAEIVDPFGNPHAHAAEREARHRHQHDGRRKDQHDHAAPNVQRLIQRPRQQRADEAAALAIQRTHGERAHEECAVSRFHAVRGERRVHAGDAEQLKHGFHKQKNQRSEDQGLGAQLFFVEEDEHRARPAEHNRQQQAEHAAQAAHNQHAAIEEAAV